MPFAFDDSMIHHYWWHGYLILRGILPASLLRDLRSEADKARAIAYERSGPQVQRTPRLQTLGEKISLKPFQDYYDLPDLNHALERLFGPGTRPGNWTWLSILIEPKLHPRFGGWHRDGVCDIPVDEQQNPEHVAARAENIHRLRKSNQINCAIYTDSCLWFVPGSHARVRDLEGERQTYCYRKEKNPYDKSDLSDIEFERQLVDICRNFPNSMQVHLGPGDFMVYRSHAWHTGVYVPSQPRATIHDIPSYDWKEGQQPSTA